MIIFLYGKDTYRSRRKLNEIVEHYKKIHKSGLNLRYFDAGNLNFQDFKSEVETISMFREKKLVVLKDVFSNKDFQEEFLKQGEKFVNSDNIILIYEKKEIDKNNSFLKFLKKNSKFQEFKPLEGQKLKNWVKKEFEKYQVEADPEALDNLINFVGSSLWQMESEIKKLVNYKNDRKIKKEDIELLVRPKIETDIFKTIDAISEKKKSRALFLLHQHLEKGDTPLYLLAMINFQFRNLLKIKDLIEKNTPYYKIINESNLHPFVVKKNYQLAQKFSLWQLKQIYQKIFETDLKIKTGKLNPELALDLLITAI
ncbi:MAG: DNA polymerase III subunit delta [Patescibacteria group bacterium]|nr:DNA polymerase III subunit delta [Patescibacteria group bacterium]